MPSDIPKDDRCAAKVTSKVGLEVHDDVLDQSFSDDDGMVAVVVTDGEHEQQVDPTWDDVLPLLRKEWNTSAVVIQREDDDNIYRERVEIEDDDPYVTNRTNQLDGYCLRYPMDNGRCYVHQGGAPEGNAFRMKHGLYTNRSKFVQWLEDTGRDEDRRFIEIMVDSWLDDAPFERDNTAKVNELYRAAVDQLRLWYAVDEFVDLDDEPGTSEGEYSGLVYEQVIGVGEDDQPIESVDENPINLPYSRLDRDVQKKLKNMGIYDSPEKQDAEATQTLAEALSGGSE